jgi:surface protein
MFVSSIRALAFVCLVGFSSMIHLVDAACGDIHEAQFNAPATSLLQGQDGELYCAVKCLLHGQYCDTNQNGVVVLPAAARGTDSANLKNYYGVDISNWCVGLVKDFSYVFYGEVSNMARMTRATSNRPFTSSYFCVVPLQASFNQPLLWDTKSATDMGRMFFGASAFNQDISTWNTTNVVSFIGMFHGAYAFNKGISNWITTNVVTFYGMFAYARDFNQDISSWSVGASCSFNSAFYDAVSFNQNLNPWELQLVGKDCAGHAPDVGSMFRFSGCPLQRASIPGDFCQVAPSARPSGNPSSLPSVLPSLHPTKKPTKRPTKKPIKAPTQVFRIRVCLNAAVTNCSCATVATKRQCLVILRTACKAKYVAAGGLPQDFASLSRAARRRKCG